MNSQQIQDFLRALPPFKRRIIGNTTPELSYQSYKNKYGKDQFIIDLETTSPDLGSEFATFQAFAAFLVAAKPYTPSSSDITSDDEDDVGARLENFSGYSCKVCGSSRCHCSDTDAKPQDTDTAAAQMGSPFAGLTSILGDPSIAQLLPLALSALDRPDDVQASTKVVPSTADTWISGIGTTPSRTLAVVPGTLRPEANLVFDPLTLSSQLSRFGLLARFTVADTQAENVSLWSYPVDVLTPSVFTAGTGEVTYYPTPLQHYCLPFTYWRGPITYRFMAICNAYANARLWIAWEPLRQKADPLPGGATTNASFAHSMYWDISGPSSVDFTVPFESQNPWNIVGSWLWP